VLTPVRVTLAGADGDVLVGDGYGRAPYAAILTHGGGQTRHAWGRSAARLAEFGLPALSLDLRGHGESDWDRSGRYAFTDHVRDLCQVVTGQGTPVVLIGASLGGVASLVAAPRLAGLVRAVVLVDVTAKLRAEGVARILTFMRASPDGFTDLDEARSAIMAYQPHRTRQAAEGSMRRNLRRRQDGRWVWHWDPATLNFATTPWLAKQRRDMEGAAAALAVPVILIRGADSDVVSEADADAMLATTKYGVRVEVPGARHMVAGDNNDIFSSAMLDALGAAGLGGGGDDVQHTIASGGAA
jgi:pimeloyl-ACP methyl ester carboxylesterase